MDYKESIEKFELLMEAVMRKQISPKGREILDKSMEGHKKTNAKMLAKKFGVLDKDYHEKSPAEKSKISKKMGFGAEKKVVRKKAKMKFIDGSDVDPDILFMFAKRDGLNGETFIYSDAERGSFTDKPTITHYDIEQRVMDKGIDVDRASEDSYGRWIEVLEDEPDTGGVIKNPLTKGIHMSMWYPPINDKQLRNIIKSLGVKPDVVHIPL